MNKLLKKYFFLVIMLLVGFLSGCINNNPIIEEEPIDLGLEEVYKYTYSLHDENTMPIGAWSDPPAANFAGIYNNPNLISNEQYKMIKDSGLNSIYGLYNNVSLNLNNVLLSLDYAKANGIVYLVRDSQVTGATDDDDYSLLVSTMSKYKDHQAFGGVMISDEPGVVSFDDFGNLHKNFKQISPDKAFYINMLPTYANKNQLVNGAGGGTINDDTITYERYMQEYISKVKPKFYSFDFYPYTGLEYAKLRNGYFDQLSIVKKNCDENNIPYWVFIQSASWSPSSLRVPNQIEVNWQVATSLAYGAKGIQYFMYYTSMEVGAESFVGGMVDKNGNKNPMYDYVLYNNQHLNYIDHILINSVHKGLILHGTTPSNIPSRDLLENYSVLNSVSGDNALIGCFNYKGKPVYYVVNNSFSNTNSSIVLHFERDIYYNLYQHTTLTSNKTKDLTLNIPAGEGVLVEITK